MLETSQKNAGAATLGDIPGFVVLGGGVTVRAGDEVVGAVGVGGARGGNLDEQCAVAGIERAADLLSKRAAGRPHASAPGAARSSMREVTMAPRTLLAGAALVVAGLAAGLAPLDAAAQVPPSAREAAAYSGLHAAAWSGNAAAIARLFAQGAALDARDGRGRTALHVATHARRRDAIRALLQAGANIDLLDADRYDAVTIAAVADDEQTLDLLLELGARADQITSRYDGTALIAAAHLGHDGVVRRLIAAGAPLDHINNLHWTALIESIVLGDGGPRHVATLKALVDAGARSDIGDRSGVLPLHMARQRGYDEMVRILERAEAAR